MARKADKDKRQFSGSAPVEGTQPARYRYETGGPVVMKAKYGAFTDTTEVDREALAAGWKARKAAAAHRKAARVFVPAKIAKVQGDTFRDRPGTIERLIAHRGGAIPHHKQGRFLAAYCNAVIRERDAKGRTTAPDYLVNRARNHIRNLDILTARAVAARMCAERQDYIEPGPFGELLDFLFSEAKALYPTPSIHPFDATPEQVATFNRNTSRTARRTAAGAVDRQTYEATSEAGFYAPRGISRTSWCRWKRKGELEKRLGERGLLAEWHRYGPLKERGKPLDDTTCANPEAAPAAPPFMDGGWMPEHADTEAGMFPAHEPADIDINDPPDAPELGERPADLPGMTEPDGQLEERASPSAGPTEPTQANQHEDIELTETTAETTDAEFGSEHGAQPPRAAAPDGISPAFLAALQADERVRARGDAIEGESLLWLAAKAVEDIPADILDGDASALASWLTRSGHLTALQTVWIANDNRLAWTVASAKPAKQAARAGSSSSRTKTAGAASAAHGPATALRRPVLRHPGWRDDTLEDDHAA